MIRALAMIGAVLVAGCAPSPSVPRAGTGAPTIVSLNPCTDAILAEVADPAQLLAISHYSHDPRGTSMDLSTARRFPATGGTVEEVLTLDPDVVVAGSFLPPATQSALERLGMRVETFGIANSVADSEAQVEQLAQLAGHAERGAALNARIDAAFARARWDGEPTSAILWQPGEIVPGEGTLVSELLAHAGFASHSAARGMGQAEYLPLEALLADAPQVLLTADLSRAQAHLALANLPMVRARYDASLLYCGGPTIARAAERLTEVRAQVGVAK